MIVPISSMSAWSVDGLSTLWPIVERWVGEGIDWFTDDHENIVGIVVHAEDMKHWGYVLFGRVDGGEFGLLEARMNLDSWRSAEMNLLLSMNTAESRRQEMLALQRRYNWPQ